jgi:hypothetical protein
MRSTAVVSLILPSFLFLSGAGCSKAERNAESKAEWKAEDFHGKWEGDPGNLDIPRPNEVPRFLNAGEGNRMTVELGSTNITEIKTRDATMLLATSFSKEGDKFILTMQSTPPLKWQATLSKEGSTLHLEGIGENRGKTSLAKK